MSRLIDLAEVLRSKNAGPLHVTLDVMFRDSETYERVKASGVLTPELIAKLYSVPADEVEVITYDVVRSLKVTLPRKTVSGDLGDEDVYGCQQQVALAEVAIP